MSEKDLILGCINKDPKCQKALFDKYSGILMTICRRYFVDHSLAQDAFQEGFVRIFKNLNQFSHKGSFEGWLKRIVVNVCLRKLQKEIKKFDWNDLEKSSFEAVKPTAESRMREEELLKVIAQLPSGYRTVFNLYAIDGFSHKEIAEKLGITDSTSRSQLVKARKMIQKMLKELNE